MYSDPAAERVSMCCGGLFVWVVMQNAIDEVVTRGFNGALPLSYGAAFC